MASSIVDRAGVDTPVLTVSDAARQLGIHPNTLRAYADAGEVHYTRLPSGHRRFSESDLQDFRERHRGGPVRVRPEEVEIEP